MSLDHLSMDQSVSQSGKIKLFRRNWHAITSDQWVLSCVQGYTIDWISQPVQDYPPRDLVFQKEDVEALSTEVKSLLKKGAITVVPYGNEEGFLSQLFAVPKKNGEIRPVVNLKSLNSFVKQESFKMEGIPTLKELLQPGDWMTKIDLKDAYFAIPIATNHQKFLRFRWQGVTYQFQCLPFGLSSAPWVFTKTTKPVVTILRSLGMRVIIYIDDILILAPDKQTAVEHTACLIFLFENLGFTINREKSQTDPTQEIEFLGLIADSRLMELKLPGSKIKSIRAEARSIVRSSPYPTAREVSRLLGKLTHAAHAMTAAPLFFRHLQSCLQHALQPAQNYDVPCHLTSEARDELTWWADYLPTWNGKSILRSEPDLTIETDASTVGWGARCGDLQTGGPWSKAETSNHINCLELMAATLAVKTFAKDKQNILIHLKMDNTSALSYINKMGGTVSPDLNRCTKSLWTWCLERNISLRASHLAGSLNTRADEESRIMKDRSDWMLCPIIFQEINLRFGPLQIDLFASRLTSQLPNYASWRPDPFASATDAFTMDWSIAVGYANPPWNLIGRVLSQARQQEATLVLVAPVWRAQPWYPNLLEILIDKPLLLPRVPRLIQPTHPVNNPDIRPQLAAWHISGQSSLQEAFRLKLQTSSLHPGGRSQVNHTIPSSGNGLAGVSNGVSIPFQETSQAL